MNRILKNIFEMKVAGILNAKDVSSKEGVQLKKNQMVLDILTITTRDQQKKAERFC
jgi:hypothetical protein